MPPIHQGAHQFSLRGSRTNGVKLLQRNTEFVDRVGAHRAKQHIHQIGVLIGSVGRFFPGPAVLRREHSLDFQETAAKSGQNPKRSGSQMLIIQQLAEAIRRHGEEPLGLALDLVIIF